MKVKLYKFDIEDFKEVYAVVDDNAKRLHISPVFYKYNVTIDLTKELDHEVEQLGKWDEISVSKRCKDVTRSIIEDLQREGII